MRLLQVLIQALIFFLAVSQSLAMDHASDNSQVFHSFVLEAEAGRARDGSAQGWDLDGWIGHDDNRLWLKSEKKTFGGYDKKFESQALYGRKVSQFWDGQFGIRHDFNTDFSHEQVNYLTAGFEGITPYQFETDAHVFLSEKGNWSARLKQEVDVLITQKLILQPYFEADFFAQDVPQLNVKSGLSELEVGALTWYELNRKFAPYISFRYNSKMFGTRNLAQGQGVRTDNFICNIGLRLRF